jgi:CHAD domain-containing protein
MVKLPSWGRGQTATDREIGFDGPPSRIPEQAADLVVAAARGGLLGSIAHVRTDRCAVDLIDDRGELLAQIAVDTTTASTIGGGRLVVREVWLESRTHGRVARRVLGAATDRLVDAGCVAKPPVSKLVRALGPTAAQPRDVLVVPLGRRPDVAELVGHTIARSVAQIFRHDPGSRLGDDPEDVHQLRVGTRRLRSDLRTFGPLLHADRTARVRTELNWLGGQVGAVRDLDVLGLRLAAAVQALPEADTAGGARLLARLTTQTANARAGMLAALRAPRYVALLDDLVELAARPPLRDDIDLHQRAASIAGRLVRRPWRRLAAAAGELGENASDAELHQVRILAKRCRYAAEAVAFAVGRVAADFAAGIADVQTVLGDHQDTVVAEEWLRDAASALPAARVAAGQLIAGVRARRAELRARWPAAWQAASAKNRRSWL